MNVRWFVGLLGVALAIVLALVPQKAFACSCVVPGPQTDALAQSSAVFAATVKGIDYDFSTGSSADPVRVTFTVSRVWKGPISRVLTVETPISGASCGYGFRLHQDYIVYAYRNVQGGNGLVVSLCSRTRTVDKAQEDFAALDAGTVPPARMYFPGMYASSCEHCLPGSLKAHDDFHTFLELLEVANLIEALEMAGPFTIFEPTDEAFANLPAGALDQLRANPTGQLTKILLYHILPGYLELDDLEIGTQIITQQGKPIFVEQNIEGRVTINSARIITPNLYASNGVIHVLDTVILPPPDDLQR